MGFVSDYTCQCIENIEDVADLYRLMDQVEHAREYRSINKVARNGILVEIKLEIIRRQTIGR